MGLVPGGFEFAQPEEELLLQTTRDFAREVLAPADRRWDRDETSVRELLPHIARMGLMNLLLPQELNGLDLSYRLYAAVIHEISKWSPSTGVTLCVHNMAGKILSHCAREPRRSEWLSEFGQPEHLAAFALSEAGAGSDARAIKTSAKEADGGLTVTGEKMWITNGISARWFLTLVRLHGVPESRSYCAVMIDGESPGLERTKISGKMGIRGSETAVISLNDVFVPEDHLIDERGSGLRVFLTCLNEGRVGIACQASGIAEACLEETISYARQREQFSKPIGRFQAVGNMVADGVTELEVAKALIWDAACRLDAAQSDRAASSKAKLYATEAANRIAYRAVQVHGGTGFVNECRVEQLYRDARVTTIYEGTSEVQRIVIADELRKKHG